MSLGTKHNTNRTAAAIYILFVIALTWKLPLSHYIRFNMGLVFMWFVILSLATFIALSINVWVGSFLAYSIFSANVPNPTPFSGAALLMVILGSVLYLILYNIENKRAAYTLLCLFALANVFAVILQQSGLDFQHVPNLRLMASDKSIRIGLMENHNSLSAALAFSLPAFFESRWKWLIPFVFLGLILAKTMGGILAVCPTVFYYANKYLSIYVSKGLRITAAIFIVIFGVVVYIRYVDPPNYKSRWAAWEMYGNLSTDQAHNLWIGKGLGHWKAVFGRKDIRIAIARKAGSQNRGGLYYAQAHNEPIQVNFEMGWIGTALIIGFFINMLRRVKHITDPRPVLAVLAVAINSLVYFPMHIPFLAMVVILWFTTMENGFRENNKC